MQATSECPPDQQCRRAQSILSNKVGDVFVRALIRIVLASASPSTASQQVPHRLDTGQALNTQPAAQRRPAAMQPKLPKQHDLVCCTPLPKLVTADTRALPPPLANTAQRTCSDPRPHVPWSELLRPEVSGRFGERQRNTMRTATNENGPKNQYNQQSKHAITKLKPMTPETHTNHEHTPTEATHSNRNQHTAIRKTCHNQTTHTSTHRKQTQNTNTRTVPCGV